MPYLKKTYFCGNVIEIEKIYSAFYKSKKITRAPKLNKSSEALQKSNDRRAAKKLRRLINTNFGLNDFSLTLTYDNEHRPSDPSAAKRLLTNFLRRLKKAYKKAGLELKYIATTEVGQLHGTIHHHLIVNKINPAIIANTWGMGLIRTSLLNSSGQYKQLASYIIKETSKNYNDPDKSFCKKRWTASANLKQPKVKVEICTADAWREDPLPVKGFVVAEVYRAVNEITGYPYQTYTLISIPLFKNYLSQEDLDYAYQAKTRRPKARTRHTHRSQREPYVQGQLF